MGLFSFLRGSGSEELKKKEEEAKAAMDETNRAAQEALLNTQKQFMLEDIVKTTNIPVENLSVNLMMGQLQFLVM